MKIVHWRDWSGLALQRVAIVESADGIRFDGVAISKGPPSIAVRYKVDCSVDWVTRRVSVQDLDNGHTIVLDHDGAGSWMLDGMRAADLGGALDPDISVTPLTNSFPVRRLKLTPGQSADIRTAYVDCMAMRAFADPQRYTCLDEGRRYRYESLDSDFSREISFGHDGLVDVYPGLFRRC